MRGAFLSCVMEIVSLALPPDIVATTVKVPLSKDDKSVPALSHSPPVTLAVKLIELLFWSVTTISMVVPSSAVEVPETTALIASSTLR